MQQNVTKEQLRFIRLNPTVGYETPKPKILKVFPKPVEVLPEIEIDLDACDPDLDEEIDLAIDFQLECVAPLARFAAEKRGRAYEPRLSDPTWIERFDSEAEASFDASFDAFGDDPPTATPSLPPIPSIAELAALRDEIVRDRKKGAA